eukprot:818068-Amphidinium_carterae.2
MFLCFGLFAPQVSSSSFAQASATSPGKWHRACNMPRQQTSQIGSTTGLQRLRGHRRSDWDGRNLHCEVPAAPFDKVDTLVRDMDTRMSMCAYMHGIADASARTGASIRPHACEDACPDVHTHMTSSPCPPLNPLVALCRFRACGAVRTWTNAGRNLLGFGPRLELATRTAPAFLGLSCCVHCLRSCCRYVVQYTGCAYEVAHRRKRSLLEKQFAMPEAKMSAPCRSATPHVVLTGSCGEARP